MTGLYGEYGKIGQGINHLENGARLSRESGNDAIDVAMVEAPTSFPRMRE